MCERERGGRGGNETGTMHVVKEEEEQFLIVQKLVDEVGLVLKGKGGWYG